MKQLGGAHQSIVSRRKSVRRLQKNSLGRAEVFRDLFDVFFDLLDRRAFEARVLEISAEGATIMRTAARHLQICRIRLERRTIDSTRKMYFAFLLNVDALFYSDGIF